MSSTLLGIVALIYLGVAVSYWREGNPGMCLAFVAYAVANVGFMTATK